MFSLCDYGNVLLSLLLSLCFMLSCTTAHFCSTSSLSCGFWNYDFDTWFSRVLGRSESVPLALPLPVSMFVWIQVYKYVFRLSVQPKYDDIRTSPLFSVCFPSSFDEDHFYYEILPKYYYYILYWAVEFTDFVDFQFYILSW